MKCEKREIYVLLVNMCIVSETIIIEYKGNTDYNQRTNRTKRFFFTRDIKRYILQCYTFLTSEPDGLSFLHCLISLFSIAKELLYRWFIVLFNVYTSLLDSSLTSYESLGAVDKTLGAVDAVMGSLSIKVKPFIGLSCDRYPRIPQKFSSFCVFVLFKCLSLSLN